MAKIMSEQGHQYALFGGGLLGFEIGAGLAARLGAGVTMEVTQVNVVDGKLAAERPILGDSSISTSTYKDKGIIIGRLNAFEAKETGGGAATVEDVQVELSPWSTKAKMVQRGEQRGADVDIEGADILVAGGRGLGKAEGFELCEELAKAFGGNSAVAATRAVVDAGWYPYAAQIGQTGKTVAPKLYLAAGISGRDPAQGRHAVLGEHRGDQQGRERPDLRVLRPRHRGRPEQDPAQAHRGHQGEEGRLIDVASRNGAVAPSEFPPPVDPVGEFVKRELDARTSASRSASPSSAAARPAWPRPTGCCSCSRDDPETLERLGEVPVAVIEKAKTCGGHNLSGAVMRPGPLQELFPDMTREQWREQGFAFGEVDQGGRLHDADLQARASGSRRRRRSRTTATRSSRWRRWRATSSSRPRRAGRTS